MAIRKPNLDEITGSVDAFVGSFDSDSDLLKADATLTNLTLEELDAFVSNLDALDTFGNVDTNYAFGIKNMSADVTAAVTVQAELAFAILFDASASLAVTATADAKRVKDFTASASASVTGTGTALRQRLCEAAVSVAGTSSTPEFFRIRGMDADVTGAASVSAIARFIARMDASASVAVTGTGAYGLIRPFEASADAAVTTANQFIAIRGMDADVSIAVTDVVGAVGEFVMSATAGAVVTGTLEGEILGEKWATVEEENETWTDITAGSEVWSQVAKGSEVWLTQ